MKETTRFRDGSGWEESAGYSRALRRGNHIFVSGTTAEGDNVRIQADAAIRRGLTAIEKLGGCVEDVVRTRLYLAPGADWSEAAAVHAEHFSSIRPANTTLHVHDLIGDGYLIEVEIEALVSE